jgi:aminopeptidase N
LNEGFATAMTHKPLEPWDRAWDQSLEEAQATVNVIDLDSLQSTRPIRQNGETPAEIKELFDGIAYQKGAALLRMVEAFVGPEVFRDGVRAYLKKYANGNATAEELYAELTRVSKRPVDRVMASFVDQPGAPLVTVEARCEEDSTRVTLTQQRFFNDARLLAAGSPELWTVPVCLRSPTGPPHCVLLTEKSQSFKLEGCAPWVLANAGARGYYRSAYTAEALREISKAAATVLTPAEQISLLNDQWALTRAGRADVAGLLALAEGLAGSRELMVQQALLGLLQTLDESVVDASRRDRYQAWLRDLARPAAREIGWSVAPGDSDDRKALRGLLLGTLGQSGDAETLAEARRLANRLLANPESVDPSLAALVLGLAARQGDATLYDTYLARMAAAKSPEEYYRYLNALPAFKDEALIRRSLDLALTGKVRAQDLPGFTAALLRNSASRPQAWAFLKANWPSLQDKVVSFGGRGAIPALAAFCNEESAVDIERFFQTNRAPGAERALKTSLESIRNCVALRKLQGDKLGAWIDGR